MTTANVKTSLRSTLRNRWFSTLRLLSLSVGLTGCFLIALYVDHETSFDQFHQRSEEIFRVVEETRQTDGFFRIRPYTGTPLSQYLREGEGISSERVAILPGVVANARSAFREDQIAFVDPGFLSIFSYPLLSGEAATVLNQPFQVVMTQSSAIKYFGESNPVGQRLVYAGEHELIVTGVIEDVPSNSHLQFDLLVSFATLERIIPSWSKHWDAGVATYLTAESVPAMAQLQHGLDRVASRVRNSDEITIIYSLETLPSIHLTWNGSPEKLIILIALALIMLAISLINFINLSSSLMLKRLPEMAIRRLLGATGRQIFFLSATESLGFLLVSSLVGLALVELSLPFAESLTSTELTILQFVTPVRIVIFLSCLLWLAAITGGLTYLLNQLRSPISVPRGSLAADGKRSLFGSGLIILQLAMTTGLIAAALVTSNQSHYLVSKDLGFDPDNLIVLPLPTTGSKVKFQTLKNSMQNCYGITEVTGSSKRPGDTDINALSYVTSENNEPINLPTLWVDADYLRTMKIKLLREANELDGTINGSEPLFLLNQSAAHKLSLEHLSDLSLEAYAGGVGNQSPWYEGVVTSITNDFNFRHLRIPLQPLVMINDPRRCRFLILRFDTDDMERTVAAVRKEWETYAPIAPFEMSFLIDDLNQSYQGERRQAEITSVACAFSILMSCLGLFGTVTLAARRRTREIGIRVVLGSSVRGITFMLIKEYFVLVVVASVLSAPFAYYFLEQWLTNFAHRVELGTGPFVISCFISIVITLISVCTPSLRAAGANPAESLRTE